MGGTHLPIIKNKRYLLHFKKGRFEVMTPKEFYEKLQELKKDKRIKPHLFNPFKYFFLLLFWTGARPGQTLELQAQNFRKTQLLDREKNEYNEYLAIDIPPKKHEKLGEVYLSFDNIPLLDKLWQWVESAPEGYTPFHALFSRGKRLIKWKSGKGHQSKEYKDLAARMFYWSIKLFEVPPYFFRHNRFTDMKLKGAKAEDIKTFKRARTMASVEAYIHPDEEELRQLAKNIIK